MQYRLRTLMIAGAIGPPALAGTFHAAPIMLKLLDFAELVFMVLPFAVPLSVASAVVALILKRSYWHQSLMIRPRRHRRATAVGSSIQLT
jgi:hypothetical protein